MTPIARGKRLEGAVLAAGALVAALVLAVTIFADKAQAGSGSGCADSLGCIWELPEFEGGKRTFQGQDILDWTYTAQRTKSAKNRFGNRKFVFGYFGDCGADNICRYDCLNPGANRQFGRDDVRVVMAGSVGSRCS